MGASQKIRRRICRDGYLSRNQRKIVAKEIANDEVQIGNGDNGGREAVRDDVRVGSGTESSREPSLGDNQGGDLRVNDRLTEEVKQGYSIQ